MLKQKDWVNVLVERLGCSKKDAKDYYDFIFDCLKENISEEDALKIANFGVFKLRKTMAKEQVNLVTQQVEVVPEHYVVTFKPYFELQPKPEAIEVEDENVGAAFDAAAAVTAAAEVAMAEERQREAEEKRRAEEERKAAEEAKKQEEEKQPEPEEKEPEPEFVEKEQPEEKDEVKVSEPNELHWFYEGQEHTEKEIKLVLLQKAGVDESDIVASLAIVKNYIKQTAPDTKNVTVVEEKETFNFVFEK